MKEKNRLMFAFLIFSAILLVLVGVSTAYVDDEDDRNDVKNLVNINAATDSDLKLVFDECNNGDDNCTSISKNLKIGESISKTFSISNEAPYDSLKYTLYFKELVNTFKNEELVFKLESLDDGKVIVQEMSVPYREYVDINIPFTEEIEIKKGEVQKYKITVTFLSKDYNQVENQDAEYYMTIGFTETKREKIASVNSYPRTYTPDFKKESISDEGLYEGADNYGRTYYYRGDVKNNYVSFAGYIWRIVRINGDGTMRIAYDGTTAHANNEASIDRILSDTTEWSDAMNDAKYAGYMYGIKESSTSVNDIQVNEENAKIKNILDDWYKINILDKGYSEFVSDTMFCNDKGIYSGNNIGNEKTNFNGFNRLENDTNPVYICTNKSSSFTVSDTNRGNGDLTYPIGLLTADEVIAAGTGSFELGSTKNYLYKGYDYWTMTPATYENGFLNMYYVNSTNMTKLSKDNALTKKGLVPVINLKSEYTNVLSGFGTMENPYTIP